MPFVHCDVVLMHFEADPLARADIRSAAYVWPGRGQGDHAVLYPLPGGSEDFQQDEPRLGSISGLLSKLISPTLSASSTALLDAADPAWLSDRMRIDARWLPAHVITPHRNCQVSIRGPNGHQEELVSKIRLEIVSV